MVLESSTAIHKTILTLWDVGAIGGLTDAQLLERFLAGPDDVSEASFAELIERHGPMVRRVCRDLLGDHHEAQDAAQAAFLVLARKARSIRKPESLGPWLHGVAVRLARRARTQTARRRTAERRRAEAMVERFEANETAAPELHVELHEEISRLPDKYRSPIILCYLEGYTHEQASRRLGWPLGTVQTRLHRGRERLRNRLSRRGVGLEGPAAIALGLPRNTAMAAPIPVSHDWARTTAAAAVRFAARKTTAGLVAPSVVRLAERALAAMLRNTLKALALGILVLHLAGGGVVLGLQAGASGREPQGQPAKPVARGEPAPRVQAEPARAILPSRKRPEIERAIEAGVRFLKDGQRPDGTWPDLDNDARTGTTSLVTLALLGVDVPANSPNVAKAVQYLRGFTPDQLGSVYAVSLQTRVFAAIGDEQDRPRIARNVQWLEDAQIVAGDRVAQPGAWTYSRFKTRNGDNSNTSYALFGLHAAAEAGMPVRPNVWTLAGRYWDGIQRADGGWGYTADARAPSTASMTCGGIASLVLSRTHRPERQEIPEGAGGPDCGKVNDPGVRKGIDWLANHFDVGMNHGEGLQWRLYFLDALGRVGQITGERWFGGHDWYREGAERLLRDQDLAKGSWSGSLFENDPTLATSFALLFLAKGRSPLLMHKLRHGHGDDWKNDPDDVRNLVATVARDWKAPLDWQVADLEQATIEDLLRAPILFLNGHRAPDLTDRGKEALRAYVDRGGFLFAEACCGEKDFDRGLRALLAEVFPAAESRLHPLAADHPVWTARHSVNSAAHPLWGLERAGRTVAIYSPGDLSCRWNVRERNPADPATDLAIRVGQNVVTFATARRAAPR